MWKTIVDMSDFVWDIAKAMANVITDFFTEDISEAIGNLNIPIISDAIEWVLVNIFGQIGIEEITVFQFLFTSGVTIWLTIAIVKFFKSIVL